MDVVSGLMNLVKTFSENASIDVKITRKDAHTGAAAELDMYEHLERLETMLGAAKSIVTTLKEMCDK